MRQISKEILKDLAQDVPYLVSRYIDTNLAEYPELWILADYILWLVGLVTDVVVGEGFEEDLFGSVPSLPTGMKRATGCTLRFWTRRNWNANMYCNPRWNLPWQG